jgi:hypothetical protein
MFSVVRVAVLCTHSVLGAKNPCRPMRQLHPFGRQIHPFGAGGGICAELTRLGATNVVVLGGTGAVSDTAANLTRCSG